MDISDPDLCASCGLFTSDCTCFLPSEEEDFDFSMEPDYDRTPSSFESSSGVISFPPLTQNNQGFPSGQMNIEWDPFLPDSVNLDEEYPLFPELLSLQSNVAITPFGGGFLNFNALDVPTYARKFRIMSWNIERLGDTGKLGKNGGVRPDDVIEAIAKIIHKANPHICALIEVFTGANGVSEVKRILSALANLCQHTGIVWGADVSPGAGTGGLSDLNGSNRRDTEGYAVFWRKDLGIECTNIKWLKIYDCDELYIKTTKGYSFVRDACEFMMKVNGKTFFGPGGADLTFPIAVFHAPGPRADVQRQMLIKDAIASLFACYASSEGDRQTTPNAFICADFNASEDADNLVEEEDYHAVDYSFPGDLEYVSRLITVVTKIELMKQWLELNKGAQGMEWSRDSIEHLLNYFETDNFKKAALETDKKVLEYVENEAESAELWFAKNSQTLKLTGSREAEKNAKLRLNAIMEERIRRNISNKQFESDKNRFALWKRAAFTTVESTFNKTLRELEKIEGADFLVYYLEDQMTQPQTWQEKQAVVAIAFEDEFEDEQAFLGSRSIKTYTDKIVSVTMQNVRYLIKNNKKLNIVESYETAFSSGVDTGFFESTSYDETLKTTRRKSILLTGFASGKKGGKWQLVKNAAPGSVLFSNYDQVLSRTDGERVDEPRIETIPVLDCVLPKDWLPAFNSNYVGCVYQDLKIPRMHRFFIKVCATANALYKELLKKYDSIDFNVKYQAALHISDNFTFNPPYCCTKQCALFDDIKFLHVLQIYLNRSHAISDHEPVMMTAIFNPHIGFTGELRD